MPDLLDTVRFELDTRLDELRPFVSEYEQLLNAVETDEQVATPSPTDASPSSLEQPATLAASRQSELTPPTHASPSLHEQAAAPTSPSQSEATSALTLVSPDPYEQVELAQPLSQSEPAPALTVASPDSNEQSAPPDPTPPNKSPAPIHRGYVRRRPVRPPFPKSSRSSSRQVAH
jgi:hypothetical protein